MDGLFDFDDNDEMMMVVFMLMIFFFCVNKSVYNFNNNDEM